MLEGNIIKNKILTVDELVEEEEVDKTESSAEHLSSGAEPSGNQYGTASDNEAAGTGTS